MTNSRPVTRRKNDYTLYKSKEGTLPYNELTEAEKIAEGTRQPFYVAPDFSKDKKEKKYLKKLKFKNKDYSNSSGVSLHSFGPMCRVTVHLKNNRANNLRGDKQLFATTHTFNSRTPERDAYFLASSLHTQVQSLTVNGKKIN